MAAGRPSRGLIKPRKRASSKGKNQLETRYEVNVLEPRRCAGEILSYRYQAIKLVLADNTSYTPDYVVTTHDQIELHEVKGYWEDDARAKWKIAAELWPEFKFVAIIFRKNQWIYEVYGEE